MAEDTQKVNGGKRRGAGRPKGSVTRVRVLDHFDENEITLFFQDLKERAKTDTKIAIYLAEQMTGKAVQSIVGKDGADLFPSSVSSLTNQDLEQLANKKPA